jgi:hypothetical protein
VEIAALREATRRQISLSFRWRVYRHSAQSWEETGQPRLAEITAALEAGSFAQEARTRLAEIDAELADLGYDLEAHENYARRRALAVKARNTSRNWRMPGQLWGNRT